MALADRQGSGFGSGDRGPIRAGRLAWHWIGALRHNGVGSGVGREESGEMWERGLTTLLLAIAVLLPAEGLLAQPRASSLAQPSAPPPPPLPRTILPAPRPVIELIAELSASSFARRQRATRELYRVGAPAAVPLGRAARGVDVGDRLFPVGTILFFCTCISLVLSLFCLCRLLVPEKGIDFRRKTRHARATRL